MSGRAKKGTLFAALCGQKHIGSDYINEAVALGASAILTDAPLLYGVHVPVIISGEVKTVLSRLCARIYAGHAAPKIIAVTGTNGKTTVAMATADILSASGIKTAVIGTVGAGLYGSLSPSYSGMTTPIPEELFRSVGSLYDAGAEYIVMEVSSHAIAEGRLTGLRDTKCVPRVAVFTNLSPEHLDYHSDMEEYFSVKSRLFTDFGFEKSVINVTDEYGKRLCETAGGNAVTFGDGGEYRAENIRYGENGVEYTAASRRIRMSVRCPAVGAYMAENTLSAAVTAITDGVDPLSVFDALYGFRGVIGRMERVDTGDFCAQVYIDFAHTPEALRALLENVRILYPEGRIVLVFGCGGERDRSKRAVMGRIASEKADFTVVTSDNSRGERTEDIISEIVSGMKTNSPYSVIPSRKDAIEYVIRNAVAEDVILLAGKGHELYEDKNGIKTHFDERSVVKCVLDKINGS